MESPLSADDISLLTTYLTDPSHNPKDEETRERIILACETAITSLRTPIETARKHAFLSLDHAVTRTAVSLNIFALLTTSPDGHPTTNGLASSTTPPCHPTLLRRLLRYLASPLRLVVEQGPDEWSISSTGQILASDSFSAGCKMYFDTCGPAFRALPGWVASSPQSGTPFQAAGEKDFFTWLHRDAASLQDFHDWMNTLAKHQFAAQETIDFREWISTADVLAGNEGVAFVDVGGGSGGQCLALRKKMGQSGRIVNQDREEVVREAKTSLGEVGIEVMAHDFFEEQPIRGSQIYHFRQILHDWPDDDCVRILKRTREAMDFTSTLLIDEVVMPDCGAHWMVTQRDLTMLALFNAGERTEQEWRTLIGQAGLVLEEIRPYDARMAACVLVAKVAKPNRAG
ncbi:S-adenosyl-L-methionine-dependent methyltransferase [Apodospora peruviana]|uniref:S-adenosyl-L-methionine-dependent methyltransferase n=1 Tax=Apodospora peruviana TaxID=516989 RepID=A0AAE0LYT3_9PEZI|nr:S-adenosyl-L-methionine-dependent methyltransferase [Apodospora peruviana]